MHNKSDLFSVKCPFTVLSLLTVSFVDTDAPHETVAIISSSNVKKGNTVTLTCSSRGRPNISISWYKDGQHTANGAELKLHSITATQSGKYQCQAKNEHGTEDSNVLHVDVKCEKFLFACEE